MKGAWTLRSAIGDRASPIINRRARCTTGWRSTLNIIGQVAPAAERTLRAAELVAVGSELTTGETRDTNGGELARALAGSGVHVDRILALPDDLALVTTALRDALASVDLVVATGGLGPTPDDLTREALAAAVGEVPAVDPELETWLRDLFARRGIPLPEVNLKQAWRIPSATTIPNPNGTAPGWWVDRPDGRVAVLLPGPPREMRVMWSDWVLPRLRARRLGDGRVMRTLRTYGIGESHVAELLGDAMLRRVNPVVATYARADWLDVRVTAVDEPAADGIPARTADTILEQTVTGIRATLAGHVWAEGETSWADLVSAAADAAGVRLAIVEAGTTGTLGALLAEVPALERSASAGPAVVPDPAAWPVEEAAVEAARSVGVAVGVALVALTVPGEGTRLRAAVVAPDAGVSRVLDLRLFQHGAHGRFRAAVAAAAFAIEVLRTLEPAAAAS
jgi:nicotinamide-nucleotide amidase